MKEIKIGETVTLPNDKMVKCVADKESEFGCDVCVLHNKDECHEYKCFDGEDESFVMRHFEYVADKLCRDGKPCSRKGKDCSWCELNGE